MGCCIMELFRNIAGGNICSTQSAHSHNDFLYRITLEIAQKIACYIYFFKLCGFGILSYPEGKKSIKERLNLTELNGFNKITLCGHGLVINQKNSHPCIMS